MATLKKQMNCCHCRKSFRIADANFCDGGSDRTLVCPLCGKCACDRISRWMDEGKIIFGHSEPKPLGPFDWVHRDLVQQ